MNMRIRKITFIVLSAVTICQTAFAQLPAFPGAEGFGKYAMGARASSSPAIYHVTNLNDTGSGSFRDAVSQSNRIVVFDVAGVIKLSSRVVFSSNLYIAGQTAPGEGVELYGNGVSFSGANNIICRYIRIRMGINGDAGKDAAGVANGSNMMFDHLSVYWGRDETFSISGEDPSNITIQNSIIAQGLLSHSAGGLIQTGGGVSLYRNLYVDNDTRNNKIKGINQYVNNMVYNWKSGCYIMGGESEGQSYANCVSNYFINGPLDATSALGGANANFHIYATDNWNDKNRNGKADGYLVPHSEYNGGPDFQTQPYDYPVLPTWNATQLIDSLLPRVGASLPYRDILDYFVIDELKSFGKKGKFISNENENSIGTPSEWTFFKGISKTDTDKDGIPDTWENSHGLNANSSADAILKASNGYLNIENYINSIGENESQDYLRAPLVLQLDSATQNSVSVSWFDFTEKESGYIIERWNGTAFQEIDRNNVNVNHYKLSGLQAEEAVQLRVRAFNENSFSTYSNELKTKSRPVPVAVLDLEQFQPDLIWSGIPGASWNKTALNWNNGNSSFKDSSDVLISAQTSGNILLNDAVNINALVVNNDTTISIVGTGSLTGKGSVNKSGKGQFNLLIKNDYKGATVIHEGELRINSLADGGLSSSIGSSANYDFNLVLLGGTLNYAGTSVATDRNIKLEENSTLKVEQAGSKLTLNGIINGSGGITKSGPGTLYTNKIHTYEGTTNIEGGVLEINGFDIINAGLGSGNKLLLNGGTFRTSGGKTADYEYYYMPMEIADGKTSILEPYRNCYIKSKVSGSGTLQFNIPYVREYIQGDWSQFSGTLLANAFGTTSDGVQLLMNNANGIPNGRVVLNGATKVISWKNATTLYLGGLSGPSNSILAGADKQNNSATMTWIIGGAGTDETFQGIINNECSNASYKGSTSIVKEGNGYWKLTNNNIYTGTTLVNGGTLIVNGQHTGSGGVTVKDEALLAGKGKLPGNVILESGAGIQAGDPSSTSINTGTLTVGSLNMHTGSYCKMDIMKNLNLFDKIQATGNISLNGILHLNFTGTPVLGDAFVLFSGASVTGKFSAIVPESPGLGFKWVQTGGILKIVSETNALDNIDNAQIRIYPNPASEFISVESRDASSIHLYDMQGRCLISQEIKPGKNTLHLENISSGLYNLVLRNSGNKNYQQKISKI